MNDQTDTVEIENRIVRHNCDDIDADDLYSIVEDLILVGLDDLAARVEIEREKVAEFDEYSGPTFTTEEMFDITMGLTEARRQHYSQGRTEESERIEDLAGRLNRAIEDMVEEQE
jgi:hypothetical protein